MTTTTDHVAVTQSDGNDYSVATIEAPHITLNVFTGPDDEDQRDWINCNIHKIDRVTISRKHHDAVAVDPDDTFDTVRISFYSGNTYRGDITAYGTEPPTLEVK